MAPFRPLALSSLWSMVYPKMVVHLGRLEQTLRALRLAQIQQRLMSLDLSGCWDKFDRADKHVNDLIAQISKASPKGEFITLGRQYEAKYGAVVYRVKRVVNIPKKWGLIVGDAVHNFRCALDHLAWQLAVKHFNGVVPTKHKEIVNIQFPIEMNKGNWAANRFRKYMDAADVAKIERFQPFNVGPKTRARGGRHPFEMFFGFNGVDNVDKHRELQVTYVTVPSLSFTNTDRYVDCVPVMNPNGTKVVYMWGPRQSPKPGDEILRLPVTVTGPNPDVDFQASITGTIVLGEIGEVLVGINAMRETVAVVLREFMD